MSRLIIGGGLAALVLSAFTSARGVCIPDKEAANFNAFDERFAYWIPAAGTDTSPSAVVARFWQLGARSVANEGFYDDSAWMYFYPPAGGLVMNAFLSAYGVTGCAQGDLLTVVEAPSLDGSTAYFLAATIDETPPSAVHFDYSTLGNQTLFEIPTPQILSAATYGGGIVHLAVAIDPTAPGTVGPKAGSAIQSVRLVQASGAEDPGRPAAAWTAIAESEGSAAARFDDVPIACRQDASIFLATEVVFDSGVAGSYVGRATVVSCNPSLPGPVLKPLPGHRGG